MLGNFISFQFEYNRGWGLYEWNSEWLRKASSRGSSVLDLLSQELRPGRSSLMDHFRNSWVSANQTLLFQRAHFINWHHQSSYSCYWGKYWQRDSMFLWYEGGPKMPLEPSVADLGPLVVIGCECSVEIFLTGWRTLQVPALRHFWHTQPV